MFDLAVSRLEGLIAAQRPAAVPWEPVTDYSSNTRRVIELPHATRIRDIFGAASVLDVGCGHGHLMQLLLDVLPHGSVRGIDKHYRPVHDGLDIVADDIVTLNPAHHAQAHLVICREVLEHLTVREIRHAVTHLCALSERYVYVTTRFAAHPRDILDVQTADTLDPTHISLLPQAMLRLLFVLEGFRQRPDLEERLDWKRVGRVLVYERV